MLAPRAFFTVLFLSMVALCYGQDPFFVERQQIKAFVNPALTGLDGTMTVRLSVKNQYLTDNPSYLTSAISVEQSAPCKRLDFGGYYIYDREGDGFLRSHFFAGNIVYTLPFKLGRSDHNLRFGFKAEWIGKSIDWDRLYFSDQLDPKYGLTDAQGNPNPGSFVPPDWDNASQMNLGVGFVHKAVLGGLARNWTLTWGGAIENYTGLFEDKYYDSLLRLEKDRTAFVNKYSLHASAEFPISRNNRQYFGFNPSYIFQRQINLTNQQFGFSTNYQRAYSVGVYLNFADYNDFQADTKSIIFETFLRVLTTQTSQLNIGFHYMHNIGGLSEVFGQTLQVSVRYNLRKDACASTPDQRADCPAVSLSHRLLYENIWYKQTEGKKPGIWEK